VCEHVHVGRHGSPGPIKESETIYSVLTAPVDLDNEQIALTLVTHAERKGMSIMREKASDNEFELIIKSRIKDNPERWIRGFAGVSCGDVRALSTGSREETPRVRLFYILDTDMVGLPHHGDIFATFPNPYDDKDGKRARRSRRDKMLELLNKNIRDVTDFRDGAFKKYGQP
jgi:hypothetical protein